MATAVAAERARGRDFKRAQREAARERAAYQEEGDSGFGSLSGIEDVYVPESLRSSQQAPTPQQQALSEQSDTARQERLQQQEQEEEAERTEEEQARVLRAEQLRAQGIEQAQAAAEQYTSTTGGTTRQVTGARSKGAARTAQRRAAQAKGAAQKARQAREVAQAARGVKMGLRAAAVAEGLSVVGIIILILQLNAQLAIDLLGFPLREYIKLSWPEKIFIIFFDLVLLLVLFLVGIMLYAVFNPVDFGCELLDSTSPSSILGNFLNFVGQTACDLTA